MKLAIVTYLVSLLFLWLSAFLNGQPIVAVIAFIAFWVSLAFIVIHYRKPYFEKESDK